MIGAPASRRRRAVLGACVAALLALHAWLAISAMADKSPTYDEPLHLVGGTTYWQGDFRLQPENGNLPQRWAALAIRPQRPMLPTAGLEDAWATSDAPVLKDAFLYGAGNDTDRMLTTARRAALVWSLLLGLLIFLWSRRLWGDAASLFSLGLYTVSATTLAHAPLVTSDMCAAVALLAATGAFWRHLERLTPARLALSALATALATVAKFSFVVLPFVFALLALWRLMESTPWPAVIRGRERIAESRGAKARWLALSTAAHLTVAWVVIWTFYDWRYLPASDGLPEMRQYYQAWSAILPADGAVRWLVELGRSLRALPDAFLYGFTYVYAAAQQRAAFLAADYSNTGWWWFFPYAYLVKTPIAELAATLGVGALAIVRWRHAVPVERTAEIRRDLRRVLPLLALAVAYGAFSVASNLNIGHRHLLPLYAPLFVLSGALVSLGAARWRRWAAVALLALATVESIAVRPHYLAFFNAAVGGPSQGWRHLVDSSLDWGQDLPGLATWLDANRRADERAYVSAFGNGNLDHYGIDATVLAPDFEYRPRRWETLEAGVYAVSATMLQDVYSPWRGQWTPDDEAMYLKLSRDLAAQIGAGTLAPVIDPYAPWGDNLRALDRLRFARLVNYLRLRQPDAVIGYSIFVHRLSAAEIHAAVNGTTEQYLALIEATP